MHLPHDAVNRSEYLPRGIPSAIRVLALTSARGRVKTDRVSDPAPAPDPQDLIFISYAREDAEWADLLRAALEPVARRKGLRVWYDRDLQLARRWRPAIERAITRSQLGLVLLSPAAVASPEVRWEVELLQRRSRPIGIRLDGSATVPDRTVPEPLRERQRFRQPVALRDLTDAQRAAELAVMCAELDGLLREIPGAPPLPRHHRWRAEFASVRDSLLGADSDTVVLTGPAGTGKSVLAAAVAHDARVRTRYPAGVYWLPADPAAGPDEVRRRLLGRLGRVRPGLTDAELSSRLTRALDESALLLVADGVTNSALARALSTGGTASRLLVTTREPRLDTGCRARSHTIGPLGPRRARELAGAVAEQRANPVPPDIDDALARTDLTPLAVALLGAADPADRGWSRTADVLRAAQPHATDALRPVMDALGVPALPHSTPGPVRPAALSLAVFAPATTIPISTIERLWAHGRAPWAASPSAMLDELAGHGVVTIDRGSRTVHVEELTSCCLSLHAERSPMQAHNELLEACRAVLPGVPPGTWWPLLGTEPHLTDHLTRHLARAGRHAELVRIVTDPVHLAHRIAHGGVSGALADLALATPVATGSSAVAVRWWRDQLSRHADLLSDLDQDAVGEIAATLLTYLPGVGVPPTDVDLRRLDPLATDPGFLVRFGHRPRRDPTATGVLTAVGRVRAVAWAPDGSVLGTGDDRGEVRFWRTDTLAPGPTYRDRGGVHRLVWSPDGRRVAVVRGPGPRRVFAVEHARGSVTLAPAPLIGAATSAVEDSVPTVTQAFGCLAWAPDGRSLAVPRSVPGTNGSDPRAEVWLWAAEGDQWRRAHAMSGNPVAVTWTATDGEIRTYADNGRVYRWRPGSRPQPGQVSPHPVVSVAPATDARRCLLADRRGGTTHPIAVDLIDLHGGARRRITEYVATGGADILLAWAPDGSRFATSNGRRIDVWLAATGELARTLPRRGGTVTALAWSPDGSWLAAAEGTQVRLWDAEPATPPHRRPAHAPAPPRDVTPLVRADDVLSAAWAPNGEWILTGSGDGTIQLVRPDDGQARTVAVHRHPVRALAWASDSRSFVASGDELRVYEVGPRGETSARAASAAWHPVGATFDIALTWSPGDASVLAVTDSLVRRWNPTTDRVDHAELGEPEHGPVATIATWTSDGSGFATAGGPSERVLVWSRPPWGRRRGPFRRTAPRDLAPVADIWNESGSFDERRDRPGVDALAWSHDDRLVAIGGRTGVRIWRPATDRVELELPARDVSAVAWSPDDSRIAVGCASGRLLGYDRTGRACGRLRVDHVTCLEWSEHGIAVGTGGGLLTVADDAWYGVDVPLFEGRRPRSSARR